MSLRPVCSVPVDVRKLIAIVAVVSCDRAFVVVGDMDETAGRIVLEELRRISSKDK